MGLIFITINQVTHHAQVSRLNGFIDAHQTRTFSLVFELEWLGLGLKLLVN